MEKDWVSLIEKVKQWGRDKDLHDPIAEYAKMCEESGEIASELTRSRFTGPAIEDAFGDMLVCYIILSDILDIDIYKSLSSVYDIISKRTGVTINGNFVKTETSEKDD